MNEERKPVTAEGDYSELGDETLDDSSALGSICIHNDVIAVIARQAAAEVQGVVELPGDILDGIAGMIGKKSMDRGIRVTVDGESVGIDLTVILAHGVKIPQVAWELQKNVKESVEEMTGKLVSAVNVIVQGIRLPNARPE